MVPELKYITNIYIGNNILENYRMFYKILESKILDNSWNRNNFLLN